MTRRLSIVFILFLVMFIAVWTRALIGSKENFIQGETYFFNKQYIKAITFFDRSMHWYTPFNPYIERSAGYLWDISRKAEKDNDYQLSLIAIETIRNSFYSSRSLYSPGSGWIKRSGDRINNITNSQGNNIFESAKNINDKHGIYDQNIVYNDPSVFWTIVLEVSLFGWIGATCGFIFFCLVPYKKTQKYTHAYWFWVLLAFINYGLLILGMFKA